PESRTAGWRALETGGTTTRDLKLRLLEVGRLELGAFCEAKGPCPAEARQGPNGGWEFATLSFPTTTLGASWAAGSPTLFSTASGVIGLVAGPSSALRSLDFRVRPLSSLRPVVATPV